MKTRYKILTGFVLLSFAMLLMAAKLSNLPQVGRIAETNLFYVITNSGPGTWHQASVSGSNLLESFLTFPNWPATGAGDVTTAQLLAESNSLRNEFIANDTTTSNGVVTLLVANDTTTSNSLYSLIGSISTFDPNALKIFVETNGNDSTAIAGDPSKPFRTIASAASNVVNNSVVLVGPGEFTYVPTIQTNVVLDAPLNTSIGFDLKTNVAVIGSGPGTVFTSGTNWGEFINLREVENILFANFTVKDRQLTGPEHGTFALTNKNWSSVRFIGTNQNIRITGVTFKDHTRQVIDHLYGPIRTTHVMVDNCWFENVGVTNVPGAVVHDGAAFVGIGTDWTLRDSTITNAFRAIEPIHTRTPADTVQHSGVKVINVRMLGIWENAITTLSPYKDFLIENCLITRLNPTTETEGYAIKIAGGGSEFTIRGNTIRGWNHAIYSETSETNMVIEANRFINNGVGITLYVASGDGRKSTGHIVRNNFFQDISGPAIQIGGVNNAIIGNQFLNCKTNTTAGQGVIRMVNPTTNLVIRGNWYRSFQSSDTNAFCISLVGANHQIQDEIFQDYKTSIYTGTAVGTTFGFHNHKQNAALTPTDGDVWTYISALNTWTNLPSGSSGEVNVLGDSSVTNATTISWAGIKSGSTLNLKTVRAGSGIVVTNEGTNVVIASTGVSSSTNFITSSHGSLRNTNGIYFGAGNEFQAVNDGGIFKINDLVNGSSSFWMDSADASMIIGSPAVPIINVAAPINFNDTVSVTGTGAGEMIYSNSTGSAFTLVTMSDAGISTTQAYSFSAITPGQVIGFHDANGTRTNFTVTGGSSSAVGGSGAIQFAQGTSFDGTNGTVQFLFDRTNSAMRLSSSATAYIEVGNSTTGTNRVYGDQFYAGNNLKLTAQNTFWTLGSTTGALTPAGATNDIGALASRVRTNWVGTVNAAGLVSSNSAYRFTVDTNGPTAIASREIVTNIVNAAVGGGGGGGEGTNAPPYTVPITGTNFIINWLALGPTNDIVLTNYAAAGILNTNIIPGKVIRVRIDQGSQGFQTIVPNTNYFGPNWRYTAVQTGITQSTNGGYEDFIVLYGSRTNAVLSGQNWGAAP